MYFTVGEFLFSFFGHTMWHAGYEFPEQGSNLYSLQLKHRILTTRLPGKFPVYEF